MSRGRGRGITRRWSGPRRRYNSLAAGRRACAAAAAQRHYVIPRMKIAITIIVVLVGVAVVAVIVAKRRTSTAQLTPTETKIRDLVREAYAGNIVSERIELSGSDAVLVAELQNEKL